MKIHSANTLKKNAHYRVTYAMKALRDHKKSEIPHKEVTCANGLKSIHEETMSDHTMLYWADKHRAKLINEKQLA